MPIDYNDYPSDWHLRRDRVLIRDGHCCSECGIPNYAVGYRNRDGEFELIIKTASAAVGKKVKAVFAPRHPGVKLIVIVLTVAHLDHDEWNHDVSDDRLASMCQKCHLHYDSWDNNQRKKYGKRYQISVPKLIDL